MVSVDSPSPEPARDPKKTSENPSASDNLSGKAHQTASASNPAAGNAGRGSADHRSSRAAEDDHDARDPMAGSSNDRRPRTAMQVPNVAVRVRLDDQTVRDELDGAPVFVTRIRGHAYHFTRRCGNFKCARQIAELSGERPCAEASADARYAMVADFKGS